MRPCCGVSLTNPPINITLLGHPLPFHNLQLRCRPLRPRETTIITIASTPFRILQVNSSVLASSDAAGETGALKCSKPHDLNQKRDGEEIGACERGPAFQRTGTIITPRGSTRRRATNSSTVGGTSIARKRNQPEGSG